MESPSATVDHPPEKHGLPATLTLADFISHPLLQDPTKSPSFYKHSSRVKNTKKSAAIQAVGNPLKVPLRCRRKLPSIPEEDLLLNVAVVQRVPGNKTESPNGETQTPIEDEGAAAPSDMEILHASSKDTTCSVEREVLFCFPPPSWSSVMAGKIRESHTEEEQDGTAEIGTPCESQEAGQLQQEAPTVSHSDGVVVTPSVNGPPAKLRTSAGLTSGALILEVSEQLSKDGNEGTTLSEIQKLSSPNRHAAPAPKILSKKQPMAYPIPVTFCTLPNQESRPLTEDEKEFNASFPPLSNGWSMKGCSGAIFYQNSGEAQPKGDLLEPAAALPAPKEQHSDLQLIDLEKPEEEIGAMHNSTGPPQSAENAWVRNGIFGNPLPRTGGAQHPLIGVGTAATTAPQDAAKSWCNAGKTQHPLTPQGAATSVSSRAPEPVPFDPKKVRELGTAGVNKGIPSISFSSSDTEYLAGKLEHAIVGKFSHSIPSSHHIQKALRNIKFVGSFSWKHMNAKHIFLQFGAAEDYARMLNGPNGAPVWYVDSHPMRVFKWTPEFDPFFESPIAAIWCNLIGLPIHLYEHSALFAIGRLLGKPIQADHATATRSRLSYARICVEVDISVPPPEEILLDMLGKEVRQKVIWDRIPLYCSDCRHVGHGRDSCYAFGKKALPSKKDYSSVNIPRRPSHTSRHTHQVWRPRTSNGGISTSNTFASLMENEKTDEGVDIAGMTHPPSPRQVPLDDDGFQQVGRRRGKRSHHTSPTKQSSGVEDASIMLPSEEERTGAASRMDTKALGDWGSLQIRKESMAIQSAREAPKPRYYRQLANGDFDTEDIDEEMVMDEIDPGGKAVEHPPGGLAMVPGG